MEHNNQEESTPKNNGVGNFTRIGKRILFALLVVAVGYLLMNPEELKGGKELAKNGKHEAAIAEFVDGINRYSANDFSGRRTKALQRFSYKINLHNFFYNLGLSYQTLGDEKNKLANYSFALEAYTQVLQLKNNNKKALKSKELLENEFEEFFGAPYVYGSIFETNK